MLRKKYITLTTIFSVLMVFTGLSQTKEAAISTSSSTNQLEIMMGTIALLLAFVIWGMGQVLVTMGRQLLDKEKKDKALPVLTIIALMLMFSVDTYAQTATTAVAETVANYGGMNSTAFWILTSVILTELAAIGFMMFSISRMQVELVPQKAKKPGTNWSELWNRLDKRLFTKAVAVEKEADILLDHDYDGIRELDNSLPPWWKYGFVATIVVAFIYMLNFHVLGYGKDPVQEYQQELTIAALEKETYEATLVDKIDEKNLKMPSTGGIDDGKKIFLSVCSPCHGKAGEGGAGPNLTDDYWIHKGSLNNIYASIKVGYPEKGMQAWDKNYSAKEINNIAGYIKTLRGTKPANQRDPQGELFEEVMIDSTTTAK